ncbi:M15 family metallopeptidase [Motilimonas pumila]|uniref:D-alanyl-D-alanine carboxypeptidase family protein n=1 Tax=Motilimonas pumila TaxID=2303987 RepID=A0A418YGY3_9GAMM|nr:M15 family metallopeptidase [Motilimonas pumila]RJG49100.1 D-alanyl-D-alanine carboxypeptidase family protein [Motilimonas pumila]
MAKPSPQVLTGQVTTHLVRHNAWHWGQADMLVAFKQMQQAARKEGLNLTICSSFRSFERQQQIWNNKCSGSTPVLNDANRALDTSALTPRQLTAAILRWSALPGASRHHWGTDIDVYDPQLLTPGYRLQLVPAEYQTGGPLYPLACWLNQHMAKFGFYRPYDQYRGGVAQEPWHLSYLPLAGKYQQAFNIDVLDQCLNKSKIAHKAFIRHALPNLWQQYISNIAPLPR